MHRLGWKDNVKELKGRVTVPGVGWGWEQVKFVLLKDELIQWSASDGISTLGFLRISTRQWELPTQHHLQSLN